MPNITKSIGEDLGVEISNVLEKIPEIQIFANDNIAQYQWRDDRFKETSDPWKNNSYDTRSEIKTAIIKYLKSRGDVQ